MKAKQHRALCPLWNTIRRPPFDWAQGRHGAMLLQGLLLSFPDLFFSTAPWVRASYYLRDDICYTKYSIAYIPLDVNSRFTPTRAAGEWNSPAETNKSLQN
jgi:hypothetical protein